MDIWSTDKLTLFLIFFLPGFISMKVYDLMVPSAPREAAKSLHEAISYSALNFGFWSWLIALLFAGDYYQPAFHLVFFCRRPDPARRAHLLAVCLSEAGIVATGRQAIRQPDPKALGLDF